MLHAVNVPFLRPTPQRLIEWPALCSLTVPDKLEGCADPPTWIGRQWKSTIPQNGKSTKVVNIHELTIIS